jgi:hypothetical protein
MAAPQKEAASFIFEGKVTKTRASNLKSITDTGRTVIVSVERVESAPEALAGFSGHDITVQLAEGEQVKKGQRAKFYTNGWIFGENLAVQSLGHDPVTAQKPVRARVIAPKHDPARAASQQKIREHASQAPVVISGKVVAVGLPPPAPAVAAAASGVPKPTRVSEHEPFWREAVVDVQRVHKGSLDKKQVVLRFPSSTDVRWHRAPKFEPGQEGVFSLQPDRVSGHVAPGAMAASFNATDSYTCLSPADFQPAHNEVDAAVAVDAAKD